MIFILIISLILGGLGAYVIGTLEDSLNYIFSWLISWLRWNFIALFPQLFLYELAPHDHSCDSSRGHFLRNQYQASKPYAHFVHFVGRLRACLPVDQPSLLRFRHDCRFYI